MQAQAVAAVLELGEVELPGHVIHTVAPAPALYVPAPQFVHTEFPDVLVNVPATHGAHGPPFGPDEPVLQVQATDAELEAGELELVVQLLHNDTEVAPDLVEYFPVEQLVHAALPSPTLYFPRTHSEHGPPSGPVAPDTQLQAVTTELLLGDVEPTGHVVHAALPVMPLYFPASHVLHTPPSRPVYPAMHVHPVIAELALGELEPVGHARHVVAAVAASVVENVPDEQLVHLALPIPTLYFPATQVEHGPPSGPVKPEKQMQDVTVKLVPHDVEPEGHVLHSTLPAVFLYFPATQSVHGPPLGPVYPGMQVHSNTDVLAMGEIELAGHASHDVLSSTINLYFPTSQAVHVPSSAAVYPTLHVHASEPAKLENDPGPQVVHCARLLAPSMAETLPIGHAWQVIPVVAATSVEYNPAIHGMHELRALFPPDHEPAEQSVQVEAELAAVMFENLPSGQLMHVYLSEVPIAAE